MKWVLNTHLNVLAREHRRYLAELERLREMSAFAHDLGLEVHAGHGITYDTVKPIAVFPEVMELNIGHFLIGEAIFDGLENAIMKMRNLMDEA